MRVDATVRGMHRRTFVMLAMASAATAVTRASLADTTRSAARGKRILVLGGTGFLGPAVVEAALAAGHEVTLFNRGITNPMLFALLERLRGFRSGDPDDEDLSALAHRRFDAAIDVWPHDPAVAASAAQYLRDHVGHYLYVSSVAAYDSRQFERAGIAEDAPLEPWDGAASDYNRGKAESERRLSALLQDRLTIVRPGPIKGSRDTTPDLLTWLVRSQTGGRHIGPGSGDDPVEWVDVRDVARFVVLAIDGSLHGAFNLAGRPMTFREFLGRCGSATRSQAQFTWIPQAFLRSQGLKTDRELKTSAGFFPHWRPADSQPGIYQVSSEKAYDSGWRTRPFEETAWDCLATFRSGREQIEWEDPLSAEREQQVLAAWARRAS
jgi:2'-hydroxyisoflavone reductase